MIQIARTTTVVSARNGTRPGIGYAKQWTIQGGMLEEGPWPDDLIYNFGPQIDISVWVELHDAPDGRLYAKPIPTDRDIYHPTSPGA